MSELQLLGTVDVLLYSMDNFFPVVESRQFFNMLLLPNHPKLSQNFSSPSLIIGEL